MTTFPNSPRVVKGGLVLIDVESARVLRIILLQYNPDTLSRMQHIQAAKCPDSPDQFGPYAPLVAAERIKQ